MIKIDRLSKRFNHVQAVSNLSLEIPPGELFGFLGPNGAGKTTTLKMVAGLLEPDSGSVWIDGIDIQQQPELAKRRIGFIPDTPFLYEKLTGYEFLQFISLLYDIPQTVLERELEDFRAIFGYEEWIRARIETYSHGMRQKTVFMAAFLHHPKVLVVDEPMVGLDPASIRIVKQLLKDKCRQGLAVLLSTHTLEVAEEICDRVGIIHRGELLQSGTFENLRRAARSEGSLEDVFMTLVSAGDTPP